MGTKIEWADDSINPIVGCENISEGCVNCYAERIAKRSMCPQHKAVKAWDGTTAFGNKGLKGRKKSKAARKARRKSR